MYGAAPELAASPASAATSQWDLDDVEDEAQQSLSDQTAEAARMLTHPQHEAVATVVAGGLSGALAKSAVAPFSRLTILYQVNALQPSVSGRAPGLLSALRQVVRQEGVLALWKGNLATIIHRVPYSAVNFGVFEYTKAALEPHISSDVVRRLLAGAAAGLVACTAAYPLDLVRTRLSAQRDVLPRVTRLTTAAGQHHLGVTPDVRFPTPARQPLPRSLRPPRNYRGIHHAFRTILRDEGPRGLYRGLAATLLQVTPTLALNFCLYDSFKALYIRHVLVPRLAHTSHTPSNVGTFSPLGRSELGLNSETSSAGAACPSQALPHALPPLVQPHLDVSGSLICASGSGFVTSTVTFPLDVVRKRMQTASLDRGPGAEPQLSVASIMRHIARTQGWRGFYAGIWPEYGKVLPGMAIAFTTYEAVRKFLGVQPQSAGGSRS